MTKDSAPTPDELVRIANAMQTGCIGILIR